jgi:hypothetical protein
MPRTRTWSAESRNPGKSWESLEPLPAPLLTPGEVRRKRLELAQEMLTLLLGDDGIGTRPRQALLRISTSLGTVRRLL